MATHRVLVLYSKSLFAQGIEKLLRKVEGLEIVGIDLDRPEAIAQIMELAPDAVIVDTADLPAAGSALILQLLRDNSSVKVLCVSVLDGSMDIYRKQHYIVHRAEELVEALQRG